MWKQENAEVLEVERLLDEVFRIRFRADRIARDAAPGQFVHVLCSHHHSPFLRRPFSINRLDEDELSVLFKVVGEGTRLLSRVTPGQTLNLLGPAGRGFPVNVSGAHVVLVAGGMGVAPMPALAHRLLAGGNRVTAIIGARNARYVFEADHIAQCGAEVLVCTDDGSAGARRSATSMYRSLPDKGDIAYACGPLPMLYEMKQCVVTPLWLSLETRIGCGTGLCLGCAQPSGYTEDGQVVYRKVCTDGPVFHASEVILLEH
ncbi:MAG: dihydroorotate dehydrogenase electron transfer subunit [Bacillota bacterium]